jgi:hypothetical protein
MEFTLEHQSLPEYGLEALLFDMLCINPIIGFQ